MKKLIILHQDFLKIGGIETFITNFCKAFYKDYDITLVCPYIYYNNALILSDYVDIRCELDEELECDYCILTSLFINEYFLEKIKYKKIYRMIHCDLTEMNKIWNKKQEITHLDIDHITVSECSRKGLKDGYGVDSIVIPNLIEVSKKTKLLRLCSATRLTSEKGFERMKLLCDLFEKYNIPYTWDVYTNKALNNYKNMFIKESMVNVSSIYSNYDYVVQLSTSESFCFTMYESLMENVPVLVTPFPNALEEIKNGKNGYILPFDMNVSKELVLDIYNKIPKNVSYSQTGVKEKWKKILN